VSAFVAIAITTFISSHHNGEPSSSEKSKGFRATETDHMLHHTRFTVNYGNFGVFDTWAGSRLLPGKPKFKPNCQGSGVIARSESDWPKVCIQDRQVAAALKPDDTSI
jgi:sterol desaturase/sphingolipid hydroxylase (fatty acid hydroxylase superfamily)